MVVCVVYFVSAVYCVVVCVSVKLNFFCISFSNSNAQTKNQKVPLLLFFLVLFEKLDRQSKYLDVISKGLRLLLNKSSCDK